MSELARQRIRENIEKHHRGEDARVLDLRGCNMAELPEEIEECVWVEDLNLRGKTEVRDLSPLANLSALKTLNCSLTQVADLSPLANLTALQTLYCDSTQVADLSPLANLTALQTLYCYSTQVADLSPLANLTALQTFGCSGTEVADLSPLSNLAQLQILFCQSTEVADLSPLANLTALQELYCSSTQVADLSPLANLTQLQTLFCSSTQVADLSPLANLTQLLSFDCSNTQIADLSPLTNLTQLLVLACYSTQIADLSPLANLTALQELYCSNTQVADLSPLANLTQLQSLFCSSTQVADLSPLANLTQLRSLSCGETRVADLSPLANLTALQTLDCNSTQVTDLSPLANLTQLQTLDCDSTQVADLSPLANLIQLQILDCSDTQVADLYPFRKKIEEGIPVKWQTFEDHFQEGTSNWRERPAILVHGCPLICPPAEVAQESPQAVRDYFEELGDDGRKLNEVKVLFLGEASAGKTSLIKRLMGEAFDKDESQTHGIRIRKAPFEMPDGDEVTAHLWDFGGQEVMHATHQMFLSERSVYVLLLNSRNDDHAEKWLKHAASYGGRSPVLVVLNKIDENPSFQVDNKRLQEKYPQIRGFFRLSAKTDDGLAAFQEALRREIEGSDTRRTPFPLRWLAVKEHFSTMKADYIESAEFRKVCADAGVSRQFSQDVLLQFLHDLGVVINFRSLKHFDTQILNPRWLTNGIYRIINSKIVGDQTRGLLREADFDAVINDPRYREGNTTEGNYQYPTNKLHYIVRVMQEFELCFSLPNGRDYVVPQLLPVQEPDFRAAGPMLRFVVHFPDFLPDSIFPRLMVKLHTFIAGQTTSPLVSSAHVSLSHISPLAMWRTGMVLHKPNIFNALARVRWDKEDQKILVDVCGEERRRFLSFIRETVKEIVNDFTNLKFSELVPIPESREFLEYKGLVKAEDAKVKEIFVWQVEKHLPVADLLDGVEEPAMRDEVEQLPVRAFVSYSHADLEYLKELRTALAPLVRLNKLQLWDDRDIDAGDDWRQVLFQHLDECDIVLCLVSADFVASDFCWKEEFGKALAAHRRGEKTIVPIMLRQTDWQDLPLAEIQGTPGEWITSAKNRDEAWARVSETLRPALAQAKQRKKGLLEKRRGGM